MNCDGSFDVGSCEAGATVVVRDFNGKVVERCSIKFVCESPIVAEAITLRDGLKLVVEKRWQNVSIEIDSKVLHTMLYKEWKDIEMICWRMLSSR